MISKALNIDCMDYMRGLEDNAFDLAIVDPPFGLKANGASHNGGGVSQTKCAEHDADAVGCATDTGVFRRAFPSVEESDNHGWQLLQTATDKRLRGVG